jgi:predicted RNase H-like nuclease (RuvC/YqgF family)
MAEILTALGGLFTTFSFEIVVFIIIVGLFIYWFVRIRPEQQKKEAAKEANREKREKEFLEIMTRNDESSKNTIIMYERALDNSTRALENNTAALNMMSGELKSLRDESEDLKDKCKSFEGEIRKNTENIVKAVTLIESKSK